MPENKALKPRPDAKASKVVVTKADGSQEVQNAYNKFKLQSVINGKKQPRRKRKQKSKRIYVTKNKHGVVVACGPVALMKIGVELQVRNENSKVLERKTVMDLGLPFKRNGRELVYGYFKSFKERS